MARRLVKGRREELLDGVMRIIAARGFSAVHVSEIAGELHCSASSLYKIAPSKDSLVVLAIERWGLLALEDIEAHSRLGVTASERARIYFRSGARSLIPLSHEFRLDTDRFESTRLAWRTIADQFIDRFVELAGYAAEAEEIRPINQQFLGEMLRRLAWMVRDEQALGASGITAAEAVLEIDRVIWDGIKTRSADGARASGGEEGT